jgi:para-aminobenzoate synthetase component 1
MLARLLPALSADARPCLLASPEGRTVLGVRPRRVLAARHGHCTVEERGAIVRESDEDPFAFLGREVGRAAAESPRRGSPWPACGGFAGYFGYDLGRGLERIPELLADDLPMPDLWFALFDDLIVQDGRALHLPAGVEVGGAFAAAAAGSWPEPWPATHPGTQLVSPFTRAGYHAAVERILAHIRAGDLFQANLTQPFAGPCRAGPRELFVHLAEVSPAPFAAYLELDPGGAAVLSASPEEFLRIEGDRVLTRPIKGTRPRGHDAVTDERLARELLRSEKDRAELTMIVDLLRNDLGKVSVPGSVRVAAFPEHLRFAQVHHLAGTVVARLRPGVTAVEAVRAAFPGGSITGAPKLRAMQVLEGLERVRRGVYCGAIGWLALDGSARLNVAIRTVVVAGGRCRFSVGGGIVAQSVPELEYEETLAKARGIAVALRARLVAADGEVVG